MKALLEVMILTTRFRERYLNELTGQLEIQRSEVDAFNFVVVTDPSEHDTIGEKRNRLLQNSTAEYVCFIDDDDAVFPSYWLLIRDALASKPDCLSLRGIMTTDGENPQIFEHSLKYSEWKDNGAEYPNVRYERYPNHLNVIRADIAKQFKFPETNFGEDHAWSKQLHESGLLKNEVYIDKPIYYYQYRTKK